MKRLSIAFALFSLAASAASNKVTFYQPSVVQGTELKPGDYKVEVNGSTAVLTSGKLKAEAPVKLETADKKNATTSIRYGKEGDKMAVKEIRIGGSKTVLVFGDSTGKKNAE